jgi:outer membrane lipoprotein-sorting protein
MKSRWILFIIISLLTINISYSQKVDAASVLDKTVQQYNNFASGMEIIFASNIRSVKNNVSESFEGTLLIKGEKLVLTTPDVRSWFDGTTLWTYLPRTREVNVSNPGGSELQSVNPLLFLQNYKKDFTVSYTGESTSHNNKTAYDIVMIPKKKDDMEKIELQIEKSSSLPVKIVVMMKNDIRNNIIINKITQRNITDGNFVFPENEYPDAEIVDLR